MATAIILTIALGPFVLFGVAFCLAGRDESRRQREKAEYILQTGWLPAPKKCKCGKHG